MNNKTLEVPEKHTNIKHKIENRIKEITKKLPIFNKKDRVEVKLKKEVLLSDNFKNLWNKIKYKTNYEININSEEFINDCVKEINEMPNILKTVIKINRSELEIQES